MKEENLTLDRLVGQLIVHGRDAKISKNKNVIRFMLTILEGLTEALTNSLKSIEDEEKGNLSVK